MKYKEAERVLAERAGRSESAKDRAKTLSDRASQFYVTTASKEKDLLGKLDKMTNLIDAILNTHCTYTL